VLKGLTFLLTLPYRDRKLVKIKKSSPLQHIGAQCVNQEDFYALGIAWIILEKGINEFWCLYCTIQTKNKRKI